MSYLPPPTPPKKKKKGQKEKQAFCHKQVFPDAPIFKTRFSSGCLLPLHFGYFNLHTRFLLEEWPPQKYLPMFGNATTHKEALSLLNVPCSIWCRNFPIWSHDVCTSFCTTQPTATVIGKGSWWKQKMTEARGEENERVERLDGEKGMRFWKKAHQTNWMFASVSCSLSYVCLHLSITHTHAHTHTHTDTDSDTHTYIHAPLSHVSGLSLGMSPLPPGHKQLLQLSK